MALQQLGLAAGGCRRHAVLAVCAVRLAASEPCPKISSGSRSLIRQARASGAWAIIPTARPRCRTTDGNGSPVTPVPSSDSSQTVPFADTVTIARVVGALEARNKQVIIRRGNSSSFSDLREGAVVLIGAFNNEWSLRLTRQLRYSLAMDPDQHLIYIRDAKNPSSRSWSWGTNQPREPVTGANSPKLQDFALISRIRDSETGHVVVVIGGLYTYGTEAAGEFLTDPEPDAGDRQRTRASTERSKTCRLFWGPR